ncbi:MAG: isoprenylcysteine carboxylmethyltransferase family protein [Acidobacteriaceae bacterium]
MSLSTLWVWLIYGWAVGEILLAVFVRARGSRANIQDRGSQFILWGVIFGSIFAQGWVYRAVPGTIPGGHWLRLIGVVLMVIGLAVRITAIVTLGRFFTVNVATHASQTIQRRGLYSVVRHPSYLGLEICFLAVGLHSRNWACLALMLVAPTLALLYRIHVEEQALLGAFGAEYAEYSETTKRLIPGVY